MLTSSRRSALVLALLMFAAVVVLRICAAESESYGPGDIERFSALPYGFGLDPETPPFFLTWSRGDGQAFMSIAADLNGDGVSRGLGLQSYRMSRISHSALARALVLGDIDLLPYGLAAASLAAYAGLLAIAVHLTTVIGLRSMILGLSPAAIIGTIFDTSEGLGSLLLTIGITSSTVWIGVLAGGLLGVARPSYGTAIITSRSGPLVALSTVAAGVVLQVFLLFALDIPFSGSGGNIVVPLTGYLEALPAMGPAVMASATSVIVMATVLVRYSMDGGYLRRFRLAAIVSAALALSVSPSTFVGPMSPLRVSGALVVLLVLAPLFERTAPEVETTEGTTRPSLSDPAQ